MWLRIPMLLLAALSGLACNGSPPAASATGLLAPQRLELKPIYAAFPKRFSLDFTVDGAPLTNATYRVDDFPTKLGTIEVLPATPLGGGAWLEVTPAGEPATVEVQLQIATPESSWSVPMLVEIRPTPICQADDECQIATFDPGEERCITRNQTDGMLCDINAISCLQQSACQQGVCVTKVVEPIPPECTSTQPGTALTTAWKYQSDGRIYFVGTTDNDGAIYFLDCLQQQGKSTANCDLVSLDAMGVERWRTIGVVKSVTDLDPPRLMVVGSAVVLAMMNKYSNDAYFSIVDRATGTVRTQFENGQMTLSAARLNAQAVAVVLDNTVEQVDVETGNVVLSRSLPDETIGAPFMSDGAGTLIGFSSQFSPVFLEPPLPSLHLFGMTFDPPGMWVEELSRTANLTLLANFEGRLLLTTPGIRSLSTGKVTQSIRNTANLFDAILRPNHVAFAVADRALINCQERLLQKFDADSGLINWRCHLSTPFSASHNPSRLIALDNGGVIVAVEQSRTQSNAALFAVDGTRAVVLHESLPLTLDFATDLSPTMVGSRWIVNGIDPANSRESIAAFDVPGLRAASSGWITSGGRLSRDWTPLAE